MVSKHRRTVMRTIRNTLRLNRSDALIAKSDQGRAVECVAAHPASFHFLADGDFTRFADWRFVHRARLNLVPLNGSSSWRAGDRRCRRCGYNTESLSHVVDHCMRYTALYMARHNAIVARVKKATSTRFEVLSENQVLRPDLVLKKGPIIDIVDVTVPFDNRLEFFKAAATEKKDRYGCTASVVPMIVGALDSWDPGNDPFMRILCSRSYAALMRKLMADHTGSSQVAGPSNRVNPEPLLDRDDSDSDSLSDCGSSVEGIAHFPTKRRQPALEGCTLTIWYPLPTTVNRPHDDCSARFKAKLWTSAKQSVVRHIRDLHDAVEGTEVRCVGCGIVLGSHKCTVEIEGAADVVERYLCSVNGCSETFPSKQGLTNHARDHRRIDALEDAAVPLPVPLTRQRLRASQNTGPVRGGDARVPLGNVPRIPAGNIPLDTGGSPLSTAADMLSSVPGTGTSSVPRIPAGDRPDPDTGGPPLSPLPTMMPTTMRPATPRRPRGTGDRLSLPLPPPSPVRRDPELWRPRVPLPAASSSSASSDVADGNDDLVDTPLPDTLDEPEVLVDDALILQPDDTTPLHAFRERFAGLNKEPCSEAGWLRFVELAAVIAKLPARPEGRNSGRGTAIDPNDAKEIQSLYKRNRRRAVRVILSGEGQSCEVAVPEVEEHFTRTWALSTCDTSIFQRVGFNVVPPFSTLAEIIDIGLRIARSKLAPWQRMDALKTFFYPSTVYLQRLGTFPKTDWAKVDDILRPEIKATLYVPQEASVEYLYGTTKRGCCGVRLLAEDSDIVVVDSAFKLITSPDQQVAADAADHVEEVTRRRIQKDPSVQEVASYLTGKMKAFSVRRETQG
ncbi:hypothetical protein AGLY_012441 [Aphis glycines]|uniref:C2H2-type domain-containing protein n=1 Tax=Aphis glycines TaxID=307491 RepID=A0A6G0TA91_APHGL|nr:hypothetical protein AGLY_012441 [Aphis glycines]